MNEYQIGHKTTIKKQSRKGAYILAYKGHKKNAKRHIYDRYDELYVARSQLAKLKASKPKWTIHIYNYCWEVIE